MNWGARPVHPIHMAYGHAKNWLIPVLVYWMTCPMPEVTARADGPDVKLPAFPVTIREYV